MALLFGDDTLVGPPLAGERVMLSTTHRYPGIVATGHLSEALLDRFELVVLDYQSAEEEAAIEEGGGGRQNC